MLAAAFWFLGVLFFYMMDGPTHIRDIFRGNTNWSKTTGVIQWQRPSGTRILGASVNEYQIQYTVDGKSYESRCYSMKDQRVQDKPVPVEYDPDEPSRSRMVGTRTTATPIYFLPIPVGLIALFGFCGCIAFLRLLRDLT